MKRREFFRRSTPLLAAPFLVNGMRVRGVARENYLYESMLAGRLNDKILVIVQLEGGNDGLNTVVPVDDDLYYSARPNLAIAKEDALPIDGVAELRLNPVLDGLVPMFNEGKLAIVGNVGYDRMNLSHFTGTEIWHTGSKSSKDSYLTTGWVGRYLAGEYPEFPDVLPDHPPAIEISPSTSSLFTVVGSSIGMSLTDPQEFYDLVSAGPDVPDDVDVNTLAGCEWEFVDAVTRQSATFADGVRAANAAGKNSVEYPETDFAEALAIIARLVAGGLATRIYKVSLGNFDTHGNQAVTHTRLLETLGDGIAAFQSDLEGLGLDDRVVGMTYSEFGRRVDDNGPGTDHGTAAPHFVFGANVDGGKLHGGLPDLANLDRFGNLIHVVGYSCYYASVIAPLFDIPEPRLAEILPFDLCQRADYVPLYHTSSVEEERSRVPNRLDLSNR